MWRFANKVDKWRKNYHPFKEDPDSYYTARVFVSDLQDGDRMIAILNPRQAMAYGITVHSKVSIIKLNGEEIVADVSFSERVTVGTIAISEEVAKKYGFKNLEMVGVSLTESKSKTAETIRKKINLLLLHIKYRKS